MRISFCYLPLVGFATFIASCSNAPQRPSVDIEIRNDSTNDLEWVEVLWGDGKQTAGVLPAGASAVSDAGLPKSPKSDTAFIGFAYAKDGWVSLARPNSERKRYSVPIDVSALNRLSPGDYRVTLSILSFTEGKLHIEKEVK